MNFCLSSMKNYVLLLVCALRFLFELSPYLSDFHFVSFPVQLRQGAAVSVFALDSVTSPRCSSICSAQSRSKRGRSLILHPAVARSGFGLAAGALLVHVHVFFGLPPGARQVSRFSPLLLLFGRSSVRMFVLCLDLVVVSILLLQVSFSALDLFSLRSVRGSFLFFFLRTILCVVPTQPAWDFRSPVHISRSVFSLS
jgi:hypothetical protein